MNFGAVSICFCLFIHLCTVESTEDNSFKSLRNFFHLRQGGTQRFQLHIHYLPVFNVCYQEVISTASSLLLVPKWIPLYLCLSLLISCLLMGSRDSSVVRAPDLLLKGSGFRSLLERRENFLLQGQLSVLTLISVSVPPPCYHNSP